MRTWTVVLLIASGLVCARCETVPATANVHEGTGAIASETGIGTQTWLAKNPAWARNLQFKETRAVSEDGYLKVQITIENLTDDDTAYETMFEWFGADRMKIANVVEHWSPGWAGGKAIVEIQAVAPTRGAASYRFHIRPPQPIAEQG